MQARAVGNHAQSKRSVPNGSLPQILMVLGIGTVVLWSQFLLSAQADGHEFVHLKNAGFEAAVPGEAWQLDGDDAKQNFSMKVDRSDAKEGQQSLLISAERPVHLTLRQEIFLPVGTLWKLSGWAKSQVSPVVANTDGYSETPSPGPKIGIQAEAGSLGFSKSLGSLTDWNQQVVHFRVPSPGRVTITLNVLDNQSGKVRLDDIRLERESESSSVESITISGRRLGKQPIDQKQGGQFMEPLCDVLPSLTAQQVQSTSFEEETPWNYSYKSQVDKAYRPWYPDGSVHVATYSFDTNNPFNGKQSQKIDLPVPGTWAGISQDGFYFEAGHSYRLRLHMRGERNVPVRASLHAGEEMVADPALLGHATSEWKEAEVVFTSKHSIRNATLTIEFEGPGTLWLDRVYLIDTQAVLGLWRPDAVNALKAMSPGIVRFGGSTIETFEWFNTVGNWDNRLPYPDDPWGGLQDNFVGIEDFIQLTQYLGAEPLICLRWTGRTPQDAANEVEYFNGGPDTKWGRMRVKNGHRESYHVKYWEIGNEVGGPVYDASLRAFGEAMRRVDPSIKLLSSYPSQSIVRLAGPVLDYLSPHLYSIGDLSGAESEFKQLRDMIERDAPGKDIRISVTEWNANGGDWGLRRGMLHTLGNALICSRYRNLMHRYADLIEISNVSSFSHSFAGGEVQPGPGFFYTIPDYSADILYQRAAGSYPLEITRSNLLPPYLLEPDLDVTLSADGRTLRIYGVNSTAESRKVHFDLPASLGTAQSAEEFVVGDSHALPDSEAMNSPEDPQRVTSTTKTLAIAGSRFEHTFRPFSITLVEICLAKE